MDEGNFSAKGNKHLSCYLIATGLKNLWFN